MRLSAILFPITLVCSSTAMAKATEPATQSAAASATARATKGATAKATNRFECSVGEDVNERRTVYCVAVLEVTSDESGFSCSIPNLRSTNGEKQDVAVTLSTVDTQSTIQLNATIFSRPTMMLGYGRTTASKATKVVSVDIGSGQSTQYQTSVVCNRM